MIGRRRFLFAPLGIAAWICLWPVDGAQTDAVYEPTAPQTVMAPMRDCVRLAADICLPSRNRHAGRGQISGSPGAHAVQQEHRRCRRTLSGAAWLRRGDSGRARPICLGRALALRPRRPEGWFRHRQHYRFETVVASASPTRTKRCAMAFWPNRLTRSTRTM